MFARSLILNPANMVMGNIWCYLFVGCISYKYIMGETLLSADIAWSGIEMEL